MTNRKALIETLASISRDKLNQPEERIGAAGTALHWMEVTGIRDTSADTCACETPEEMPFPSIRVEARYCSPGCDKQRRHVYVNDTEVGQVCPDAPSFEWILQDLVRRAIAVDRLSR